VTTHGATHGGPAVFSHTSDPPGHREPDGPGRSPTERAGPESRFERNDAVTRSRVNDRLECLLRHARYGAIPPTQFPEIGRVSANDLDLAVVMQRKPSADSLPSATEPGYALRLCAIVALSVSLRGRQAVPKPRLRDPEPRIEPRRLLPVVLESLRESRRCRDYRPRGLHASAQVAKSSRLLPFIRLTRVVGPAGRVAECVKPRRRGRDLLPFPLD
jgi:hypothetical protein